MSGIKLEPPHISDMSQGPQYNQGDPGAIAQNYRDQLFAQCAMGNHERKTDYGMCGIITAVVSFHLVLKFENGVFPLWSDLFVHGQEGKMLTLRCFLG